jgi:hypothetical protein
MRIRPDHADCTSINILVWAYGRLVDNPISVVRWPRRTACGYLYYVSAGIANESRSGSWNLLAGRDSRSRRCRLWSGVIGVLAPRMDQVQILLTLLAAVLESATKLGVAGGEAGHQLGIIAIAFRFAAGRSRHNSLGTPAGVF